MTTDYGQKPGVRCLNTIRNSPQRREISLDGNLELTLSVNDRQLSGWVQ